MLFQATLTKYSAPKRCGSRRGKEGILCEEDGDERIMEGNVVYVHYISVYEVVKEVAILT